VLTREGRLAAPAAAISMACSSHRLLSHRLSLHLDRRPAGCSRSISARAAGAKRMLLTERTPGLHLFGSFSTLMQSISPQPSRPCCSGHRQSPCLQSTHRGLTSMGPHRHAVCQCRGMTALHRRTCSASGRTRPRLRILLLEVLDLPPICSMLFFSSRAHSTRSGRRQILQLT